MAAKKKPTKKSSKSPTEKPAKKQDAERRPRAPLQRRAPPGKQPSMTAEISLTDEAVLQLPGSVYSNTSPTTIVTPGFRIAVFYIESFTFLIHVAKLNILYDKDSWSLSGLGILVSSNINTFSAVETGAAPSALLIEGKTVYIVYMRRAFSDPAGGTIGVIRGDIVESDSLVKQWYRSEFDESVKTSIGPWACWLNGELHVAYKGVSDDRIYLAKFPKGAEWLPVEESPRFVGGRT